MKNRIFIGIALAFLSALFASARAATPPASQHAAQRGATNCSAAYGGRTASCVHVTCNKTYRSFIGTWTGEFRAYVRELSTPQKTVYRPYTNTVTYAARDCYRNTGNGDVFIIGRQRDDYPQFRSMPAATQKGLLIFGRTASGTPFMRTVNDQGTYDYKLIYRNEAAGLSIWRLRIPASGSRPEMTFTTIDGRDLEAPRPHTRTVTVTITVGSSDTTYWRGVIAYGSHDRQ